MSFFDPITLERFARFRRNRLGWWSLLTLAALSVLALLGPLLVGNRPLVLKVDGITRYPIFAGFISGRDLGLKIDLLFGRRLRRVGGGVIRGLRIRSLGVGLGFVFLLVMGILLFHGEHPIMQPASCEGQSK